jgi:hypothetical protein
MRTELMGDRWPALPVAEWQATRDTLRLWTQIVGKVRMMNGRPDGAWFEAQLGEFVLPYQLVRQADDQDGLLLDFLQSTYEAAATTAHCDRAALERS